MASESEHQKIKELELKRLILSLTNLQVNDETFNNCFSVAKRRLFRCTNQAPDKTLVFKRLSNFSYKLDYNGFPDIAVILDNAIDTFRNREGETWKSLELLLLLSLNAFKADNLYSVKDKLRDNAIPLNSAAEPQLPNELEKSYWCRLLRGDSKEYSSRDWCSACDQTSLESDDDESSSSGSQISIEKQLDTNSLRCFVLFDDLPKEECIVEDQKSNFTRAISEAISSKEWLSEHLQNTWWNEKWCLEPNSNYKAAHFGIDNDNSYLGVQCGQQTYHYRKYQYFSEYQLIRELLWILIVNDAHAANKRIEFLRTYASTPSLIHGSFKSYVEDFVEMASKYRVLRSFSNMILNKDGFQNSFTVQAYSSVLREICLLFLNTVVNFEAEVIKQAEIITLISMYGTLAPYLKEISFIYAVHNESMISDFMEDTSWVYAIRLLSVIYFKLQTQITPKYSSILLKMFLRTFSAYGDIIDQWLLDGQLTDMRNEFFVKRTDSAYTLVPFAESFNENEVQMVSIFKELSEILLNCGTKIDSIRKLNKMNDLKHELIHEGSVNDCLMKLISKHVSFYESSQHEDLLMKVDSPTDINRRIEHEIEESYYSIESPYLTEAFNDYEHVLVEKPPDPLQKHFKISTCISVDLILHQALKEIINRRAQKVDDIFRRTIVNDHRLFEHIDNLTNLILMNTHAFSEKLHDRFVRNIWEGPKIMKASLHECIESNRLQVTRFCHFTIDDVDTSDTLDYKLSHDYVKEIVKSIDRIEIHYMIQWPINEIIDEDVINTVYNSLLQLMLNIDVGLTSILKLRFSELPETGEFKILHIFRHWLILLFCDLQFYFKTTIAEFLRSEWLRTRIRIDDIGTIRQDYLRNLDLIKKKCFICPTMLSDFKDILNKIWTICDNLWNLWKETTRTIFSVSHMIPVLDLYTSVLENLSISLKRFAAEQIENVILNDLIEDIDRMRLIRQQCAVI